MNDLLGARECPRFGKMVRSCKFEPRYDEGVPTAAQPTSYHGPAGGVARMLEASKPRTYVRDVCVRCGKTIERQKP